MRRWKALLRWKKESARSREEYRQLREENEDLKQELAAARKDSSTSSKPPSSDIVKLAKPPSKGRKERKNGGNPRHPQHLRLPFAPEAVDHFDVYALHSYPDCGRKLVRSRREPEVFQQVEILQRPMVVTEHHGLAYGCPHCHKVHSGPIPETVVLAGLFGPTCDVRKLSVNPGPHARGEPGQGQSRGRHHHHSHDHALHGRTLPFVGEPGRRQHPCGLPYAAFCQGEQQRRGRLRAS